MLVSHPLPARGVYLAFCFVTSLLFATCFTAFTLYRVQVAGLSLTALVLVGTVLELTCFVFEVPTGLLADTRSRRLSVLCGTLLLGLGFALEGAFPLLGAVLLAQVISGIGYTFLSGALEAWIADESGEADLTPLFVKATQMGQMGGLLGVALSAGLGSLNLQFPMLFGGLGFVLLTLWLTQYMPERHFKPTPSFERSSWGQMTETLRSGLTLVRRSPFLLLLMGVALFWGASSEAYDRLNGAKLLEVGFPGLWNWTPVVWFSALSVLGLLLGWLTTTVLGRFITTLDRRAWPLLWLSLGLILSMVAFALSSSFVAVLVSAQVVGLLRLIHGPLSSAFIQRGLESRTRATVLSLHSQADALGQMLGGPLLGLLATRFSLTCALVAGALFLLPVLALYLRVDSKQTSLEGQTVVIE